MTIWVRSQDKKFLGEVKGFVVSEVSVNCTSHYAICKDSIAGRELGQYSSKERCLEIIDGIHKFLVNPMTATSAFSYFADGTKTAIYEMPKE